MTNLELYRTNLVIIRQVATTIINWLTLIFVLSSVASNPWSIISSFLNWTLNQKGCLTTMSIDTIPKPFYGPWEGDTKIAVGIDIGTTQSGVAFAFLQNGLSISILRLDWGLKWSKDRRKSGYSPCYKVARTRGAWPTGQDTNTRVVR
jgi:hypothetical protein